MIIGYPTSFTSINSHCTFFSSEITIKNNSRFIVKCIFTYIYIYVCVIDARLTFVDRVKGEKESCLYVTHTHAVIILI